jgi:hypothetical protein
MGASARHENAHAHPWPIAPRPALFLLALALFAASALAQDFPKLKPGLWEMERTAERGAQHPNRMTMCLDDTVQKEMFDMGAGAMKGMCSKHEFRMSGSRGTGDFVCDFGGSRMHSKSTMQMTGNTGYRTEIHTTYEPPFMGQRESTTILTARHVGACKPGQRPGDMILPNGQTLNVRDAMGGPAKGSITPPPKGAGAAQTQKSGAKPVPQGGAQPKSNRQPG